MKSNCLVLVLLIGFVSFVDESHALKCYRCNEQNNEACNKGMSTLEVHNCPNSVDKCQAYSFEVLEDGKLISIGTQRGCLSEMGSCSLIHKSMDTLSATSSAGKNIFRQKTCDVCNEDLCNNNSSTRMQATSFCLIAFLLLAFNF